MNIDDLVKTIIQYEKIKVTDFRLEKSLYNEEEIFVATVVLDEDEKYRCPICRMKCEKYGYKEGRNKWWRSLDLGKNKFYLESELARCKCPEHGVHIQKMPWALHNSDYTYIFELRVAYLAAKSPTSLVSKQFRIKWDTVGNCVNRIQNSIKEFAEITVLPSKIAIDETSYKKGYKYITTVQNLENGEIIWANEGYGKEVLKQFFKKYTSEQLAAIEYVVADGAKYITDCVEEYCPKAKRCIDPYHVVQWANEELDNARKRLASDLKKNDLH